MPGNVRLYVAEITKTEKIGHCNGNFFCNSKKTIKFSIAIKKTECYNHNIKVVKRRSYGSQSRLLYYLSVAEPVPKIIPAICMPCFSDMPWAP